MWTKSKVMVVFWRKHVLLIILFGFTTGNSTFAQSVLNRPGARCARAETRTHTHTHSRWRYHSLCGSGFSRGGGEEVKSEERRSLDFPPLKLNNICELCVGQRPFVLLNELSRSLGQRRFGGPDRRGGGQPRLGAGELTVKVSHTFTVLPHTNRASGGAHTRTCCEQVITLPSPPASAGKRDCVLARLCDI